MIANRRLQSLAISVSATVGVLCYNPCRAEDLKPDKAVTNSIGMKLARVPAGKFAMGSPESDTRANDDEKPQHQVEITKPFYMGVFEVTQSEYEKIMGQNPSYFSKTGSGQEKVSGLKTARFPVEYLRWQEAVDFCDKLSELPQEKKAGRRYRLPSEAEWEYACRAGTTTPYHFGKALSSALANFNGKLPLPGTEKGPFLGRPAVVGSYKPNAFGLYDMHGNVWEWCSDRYRADYYKMSPRTDPPGAPTGNPCVRGGSWADDAFNCRSAYRYNILPVYRFQTRGFRVVMTISTEPAEKTTTVKPITKPESTSTLSKEAAKRERIFQTKVRPFLKAYCFECHSGSEPEGNLALDVFDHATQIVTTGHKNWKKVLDKLLADVMPPEDAKQPPRAAKESLTKWIAITLSQIDCTGDPDPGHETIRRLNRSEYRNTIRDLLGIDYKKADEFPTDDVGAGGDALSLPPILMERYLSAAEEIAEKVIATGGQRKNESNLQKKILFVRPDKNLSRRKAARKILRRLATRAYRRPATDVELERLLSLTDTVHERGGSFDDEIRLALQAILVSPNFLFKVEQEPSSNALKGIKTLNDYELATRISYFLWSSMPDEELFQHARENSLRTNLKSQLTRILKDRKTQAFVGDFLAEWLQLSRLKSFQPDRNRFRDFDEELRSAMHTETEKFFEAMIREDRSILDLIDADFTFVNERLARHYGIAGVHGKQFRRISLQNTARRGLLTHASILTLTSNPTRTSPVKRGKWILSNILGAPPPAPPPGVSELIEDADGGKSQSLRKRMEVHRKNPRCAACHLQMDALGFALENFDTLGRWRTRDGKFPIDASGTLPSGETFSGARQLSTLLRNARKNEFVRCLSGKMLAYALGRELEYYDRCTVDKIVKALEKNHYKFSTLVEQIVKCDAFQKIRRKR